MKTPDTTIGVGPEQHDQEPLVRSTMAYLEPNGNFTHQVAEVYKMKQSGMRHEITLVGIKSINEMYEMVRNGQVDTAIVPTDNSSDGPVSNTIAEISKNGEDQVYIVGEAVLPIDLSLYHQPGATIQRIQSKDTALVQAKNTLAKQYPGIQLEAVASTGLAVANAAKDPTIAGLGSNISASAQGLEGLIQKDHMQDNKANATRFAVISKEPKIPPIDAENVKTTILLDIDDQPGRLFDYLDIFSQHNVNLTRIQSFKNPQKPAHVSFWIDIDGHDSSEPVSTALGSLNHNAKIHYLGTYEKADYTPPMSDESVEIHDDLVEKIRKQEAENGNPIDENEWLMVFSLPDTPGALAHALSPAAIAMVDLTRIGSSTSPRGHLDEHVFYLGMKSVYSQTEWILEEMQQRTQNLRVFNGNQLTTKESVI